jgi:hypothetical protein
MLKYDSEELKSYILCFIFYLHKVFSLKADIFLLKFQLVIEFIFLNSKIKKKAIYLQTELK